STDGSHRVPTGTIGLVFSGFQNNQSFNYTLDSNGQHAYTLYSLPVGFYNLTATYTPTGNFLPSTGTGMLHVVASGGGLTTTATIQVPPTVNHNDPNGIALVTVTSSDRRIPTGSVKLDITGHPGSPFSQNL